MTSPITQSIKTIAVAVHGTNAKIGKTSELQTINKTIVAAINELKSSSQNTEQINNLIDNKIALLTNGASDAFDTLKEIEDEIKKGSVTGEMLTQIGELKRKVQALETYVGADDDILNVVQTALQTGA